MPKTKRFQNPLKSAPQPQMETHSPNQASVQSAPIISPSPPIITHPSPPILTNLSNTSQSQSSIHTSPSHVPQSPLEPSLSNSIEGEPSHGPGNCSNDTNIGYKKSADWIVQAIDLDGSIKEITIQVKKVNSLPSGRRIVVDFEGQAPIGQAQGLLAGYCGTSATDCKLFPIGFPKWSSNNGLPKVFLDDCIATIIKPRFYFKTSKDIAKRYLNASISKKWASHRHRLWNEFYDPTKSINEIINNVPTGIERDQWAAFVNYRLQPSTLEICRKNKEIRSKQLIPHIGGSKANSRRRQEMFVKTERKVSRGEMYLETHKKKDGSFVNDEARAIGEQIELTMTQSTQDETEYSPDDAVGRVLGPEHSGRVRCMGMGAAPTNTFRNTRLRLTNLTNSSGSTSSTINWQERFIQLEDALKAYMIAREGRIPEESANVFGSTLQGNHNSSEPTTPAEGRRSSGCSNTCHDT